MGMTADAPVEVMPQSMAAAANLSPGRAVTMVTCRWFDTGDYPIEGDSPVDGDGDDDFPTR